MKNNNIDVIIAKQLSGEATEKENNELRTWLSSNSQNAKEYNKIALTYQLSKGISEEERKSIVLDRLIGRIETARKNEIRKVSSHLSTKIRWAIAASIILFITVGIIFYTKSEVDDFASNGKAIINKVNPAGQKSKVFFPDGSIVWLNSESSISYESEFNDSCRHVRLTGEAFFEVMKDVDRPFVVFSGTISTTALGTAFNVDAFNEDNITVSLTHGKVNVEATSDSGKNLELIINAGEGVVYNSKIRNSINKILIDPSKVILWRDGLLHLENATISETTTKLERWYGVEIILNNKPGERWSANGLFDNEYLDNVLQSLSFSQDFNYELKGKQVYITFKNQMPM